MKYIFFCYNTLTLCRAIKYARDVYGLKNSTIVYSDFVSDIPKRILDDFHVKYIESDLLNIRFKGLKLHIKSVIVTNKIWKVINGELSEKENNVLIVFRDNEVQETTFISRINKLTKKKVEIWIMEEGSGLYAFRRAEVRYRNLKKFIYTFAGCSLESLADNFTQGMNPQIQKVVCTKPREFLIKRNNVVVEQMIDIFTPEFNNYLFRLVGQQGIGNSIKYDYVFLTQPFHDFRENYKRLSEIHEVLLPIVFDILRKKGKTVIKLHPREQYDYFKFCGNGVDMPDRFIQQLPFECLMQTFGNPQMISMFSSACINIKTNKPSIFLGQLFKIPGAESLFDDEFYKANNIIPCKTIDEFEKALEL